MNDDDAREFAGVIADATPGDTVYVKPEGGGVITVEVVQTSLQEFHDREVYTANGRNDGAGEVAVESEQDIEAEGPPEIRIVEFTRGSNTIKAAEYVGFEKP